MQMLIDVFQYFTIFSYGIQAVLQAAMPQFNIQFPAKIGIDDLQHCVNKNVIAVDDTAVFTSTCDLLSEEKHVSPG
jgi:hypothetical protein